MSADQKTEETAEDNNLTEELRARVPKWMKAAVSKLATHRVLDDADILREAVAEYIERRQPHSRAERKLTAVS